jgi:hypothetical protein
MVDIMEDFEGKNSQNPFIFNQNPTKAEHYLNDLDKSNKYL